MSFATTIELDDSVTPYLAQAGAALEDRVGLNRAIAQEAAKDTAVYIRGLQGRDNKHTWARALGAPDSRYWAEAADQVIQGADAEAAYIGVDKPGYRRAIETYTVRPKNSRYLAIPVHPDARGRYPREFPRDELTFIPGNRLPGGKPILARDLGKDRLEAWYVLTPSVRAPQDREMLPSPQQLGESAAAGLLHHLINHGVTAKN